MSERVIKRRMRPSQPPLKNRAGGATARTWHERESLRKGLKHQCPINHHSNVDSSPCSQETGRSNSQYALCAEGLKNPSTTELGATAEDLKLFYMQNAIIDGSSMEIIQIGKEV